MYHKRRGLAWMPSTDPARPARELSPGPELALDGSTETPLPGTLPNISSQTQRQHGSEFLQVTFLPPSPSPQTNTTRELQQSLPCKDLTAQE